ncbi:MAG: serpin family protein [Clostridia bacterium]|nr:serpin family protein [Clostridia bacterium]
MLQKIIALLLLPALLCGCVAAPVQPEEPVTTPVVEEMENMENMEKEEMEGMEKTEGLPIMAAPAAGAAVDFDFTLLREALKAEKTNTVLSPTSAYLCLALMMNGADGETLREAEAVMGGTLSEVNARCKALAAALAKTAGSTQLAIANSAWVDAKKVALDADYQKRIEAELAAEVFAADLPTKAAMDAINQWVSDNTRGMIPVTLTAPLDASAAAALFNTVYFKGKWEKPFQDYGTFDSVFHKADGTEVTAPFMNGSGRHDYINDEGVEGVVLPYDDGETVFVALRPTNGTDARAFAAQLTAKRLADYMQKAERTDIYFHMPKYTVTFDITMNDALKAMGLETMFDSRADLSGVGVPVAEPLYVSTVFQKVKVIVDEQGTEAAAVTGMMMNAMAAAPAPKPTLDLDSPFVYAVVDKQSGAPLFVGVLDDPAA